MDHHELAANYSMPVGPGNAYGPPPYLYRGVEDIFVAFEADPEGFDALLPPGCEPADDVPTCLAWGRWIPFSSFGPYHEAYVMMRVRFEGTTYLYQPFIFTDNEIPLEAGREIWGFAKKLAIMERHSGGAGDAAYGEQLLFTVERPKGQRIMTLSFTPQATVDPADMEDTPVLSLRLIPSAEANRPPSVCELVRLDVAAPIHRSADGTPMLFTGRCSLTFDATTPTDPWHLLRPTKVLQGFYGVFDFDLTHGVVIHDYLTDGVTYAGTPEGAAASA